MNEEALWVREAGCTKIQRWELFQGPNNDGLVIFVCLGAFECQRVQDFTFYLIIIKLSGQLKIIKKKIMRNPRWQSPLATK